MRELKLKIAAERQEEKDYDAYTVILSSEDYHYYYYYHYDDDDDPQELHGMFACQLNILIFKRQLALKDRQIKNLHGLKSKDQRKYKKLEGSMMKPESSYIGSSEFGSPSQNVSLDNSGSTYQAPEFK